MQILKTEQYINEKLAIQPVTKDMLSDYKKPSVDETTSKFIEDNNLIWNPLSKSYDCGGDVKVSKDIVIDGKLKIRFGNVGGGFDCIKNGLTALEGAPNEVGGNFSCSFNNLATLEGAPKKVGGDFDCSSNNITTIEGAPQEVGGDFDCSYNKLTTLEGTPKKVGGDFYCSYNNLTSLEGSPDIIDGEFVCEYNNLTSLDGAPKRVGENFYCGDNPDLVLPKKKPSWVKGKIIS